MRGNPSKQLDGLNFLNDVTSVRLGLSVAYPDMPAKVSAKSSSERLSLEGALNVSREVNDGHTTSYSSLQSGFFCSA